MSMPIEQQVLAEFNVAATMRDGTVLRANVYRPAGEGRWPVLLTRLPYGKDLPIGNAVLDPLLAARQGYVVIVQDTRGRFTSEGEWRPMEGEIEDGADTVAWAAQLPYSNGKVGMYGISYFGFTQWAAATQQPPALQAIIPMMAWNDPLNGTISRGGAFELGTSANWQLTQGLNVLQRRYQGAPDPRPFGMALYGLVHTLDTLSSQGYWSLPLKDFAPVKQNDVAPAFFESLEHATDRERVDYMTIAGKHARVQVPSLNVAGWYDVFLEGTIAHFTEMRAHGGSDLARQSKLLIGPWTHGGFSNPIGDQNFGFAATAALIDMRTDIMSLQIRWFNQFLKEQETGLLQEAPIKLFVMGANVWRDEQEWPLARAVETSYYLHSTGQANTLAGDGLLSTARPEEEPGDQYDYDPAHPVPTHGGALLMTADFRPGPLDQRSIEQRTDVLVYSTPALEQDIEVTGPIRVRLWASSSAPDTDFVARLVDVFPDGTALNLTDGIIRARYRDFERDGSVSLIEPGRPYEYEINLWATSNLFKKGHRIRLDITSSCFPRWDRNQNTGHDLGADDELAIAQQTILHDASHPSEIILPIIPTA